MKCRSKSTEQVHDFNVDDVATRTTFRRLPCARVASRGNGIMVPCSKHFSKCGHIDATSYGVCSPGIPEPEASSVAYAAAYTPQSFQFVCGVLGTRQLPLCIQTGCKQLQQLLYDASELIEFTNAAYTESSMLTRVLLRLHCNVHVSSTRTSTLPCSSVSFAGAAYFDTVISVWVCFTVDRAITSYDNRHCLVLLANVTSFYIHLLFTKEGSNYNISMHT